MKARRKETGEIVDIISYDDISATCVSKKYLISYIDSQGVEHGREGTDYHLDFEPIDNLTHWQDVRAHAAIAAMQGIISSNRCIGSTNMVAKTAVRYADALIEELKKK